MRIKKVLLVALGIGVTISGCAQETTDEGYGSASVAALTSSEVDRVEITVDGTGFAATLARDGVSGNFEPVVIPDIPIGAYTFRAEAYDDAVPVTPVLLYSGTAAVTITEGIETAVTIVLQQVPPVDPFNNTVPIFQSLVYTPANPRTDEVVTLTVSVIDPDVGDVVTLLWSAPGGGTLAPPLDQASVDWTAPSTAGSFAVTVTATDSTGATASLTATLGVELRLGSSEVSIDLNTWPEVSNLVPVPTRIDVGESTSLTLSATDPDGDDLAYAWSATGCLGTFSDATVASPNFTLTDAQGGTECTLSVNITDVDTVTALPRGGSNSASVTIATGPEVSAAPTVTPCVIDGDCLPSEACVNNACESACVAAGANMLAWWPLDAENAGATEELVNANDAQLVSGATIVAGGQVGGAVGLDGVDDYVEASSAGPLDAITDAISVNAWVNPDSPSTFGAIVRKYDQAGSRGWLLGSGDGEIVFFACPPGGFSFQCRIVRANVSLQQGQWSHVAVTYDTNGATGEEVSIYLNGQAQAVLLAGSLVTEIAETSGAPVVIGARREVSNGQLYALWDGLIDEVQIFDRALSAAEIQSIYDAGPFGTCE